MLGGGFGFGLHDFCLNSYYKCGWVCCFCCLIDLGLIDFNGCCLAEFVLLSGCGGLFGV